MFVYLAGAVMANILMGAIVDNFGWDAGFMLLVGASVLATLSFIFTWNVRGQEVIK